MNLENERASGWRGKAIYALLAVVYVAWLAVLSAYPGHDVLHETVAGRVLAAVLALFGLSVVPTSWNLSLASEVKLALGPGFVTGLLVGIFYVRSLQESWKALAGC